MRITERIAEPGRYAALIEKFFGFYEPAETALFAHAGWSELGIDPRVRRKTPWLANDLRALGYSDPAIASLPRSPHVPELGNLARAFGCAYVLEGATLGGRHISAILRTSGIPANARSFFASYGEAVGERWREFVEALDSFAVQRGDSEEIVAVARETFAGMETWLCEPAEIVP